MWAYGIFMNRVEPLYAECAQQAPQCIGVTLRHPSLLCLFGHLIYRAPRFASAPVTEAAMCLNDFERAILSAEEHRRRGYVDDERRIRTQGDAARWERICRRWATKHAYLESA